MEFTQHPLFPSHQTKSNVPFPSTRYQGSKRKLTEWIWANVEHLEFDSVLDLFGGTGCVSHLFKNAGKRVVYNDALLFNWNIGLALIQNRDVVLTSEDITTIISAHPNIDYPNFIQRTFKNIYFTDSENAWLDRVVYNIDHLLENPVKQALARFALYQACIIKRPYNLFHRANLYMRQAKVERSFGNKTTWDTPFETHFRTFVTEANAAVFDNGRDNRAIHGDALEAPIDIDLVYIDPPYISAKGVGVDYHEFYHFLEGLTAYNEWPAKVDFTTKHRRMYRQNSPWVDAQQILNALKSVFARYQNAILIVSYRNNGIPSKSDLIALLRRYKPSVTEANKSQKYVLSKQNSKELLLIAP